MKILIIAEDIELTENLSHYVESCGLDTIKYRNLLKAMDNAEEIQPDFIILNCNDYPRHWKTLLQYVNGIGINSKFILINDGNLKADEAKKADALGINLILSNIDDEDNKSKLKEVLLGTEKTVETEDFVETEDSVETEDFVETDDSVAIEETVAVEDSAGTEEFVDINEFIDSEETEEKAEDEISIETEETVENEEAIETDETVVSDETDDSEENDEIQFTECEIKPRLPKPEIELPDEIEQFQTEDESEESENAVQEFFDDEGSEDFVYTRIPDSNSESHETLVENKTIEEEVIEDDDSISLEFINPKTGLNVKGQVLEYKHPMLIFQTESMEDYNTLRFGQIITNCCLKNCGKKSTVRIQIQSKNEKIEFCVLP